MSFINESLIGLSQKMQSSLSEITSSELDQVSISSSDSDSKEQFDVTSPMIESNDEDVITGWNFYKPRGAKRVKDENGDIIVWQYYYCCEYPQCIVSYKVDKRGNEKWISSTGKHNHEPPAKLQPSSTVKRNCNSKNNY